MSTPAPPSNTHFIFLDEGGDLDFSPKGSKYFTLTALSLAKPFPFAAALQELRYSLLERNIDLEYFHATEDQQHVRDQVFQIIQTGLTQVRLDTLIVEKSKTGPALRADEKFYPRMIGYVLRHVFERKGLLTVPVVVVTDSIPVNRKRQAVEKAVKQTLAHMLQPGTDYRIYHHASKACAALQVADYCNWAVFRKWERTDERSYAYVKPAMHSEFEIFRSGVTHYYKK